MSNDESEPLNWIGICVVQSAEHYVAESDWMLARVQREHQESRRWEASVATNRDVIEYRSFEPSELDIAMEWCERVIESTWADYFSQKQ